MTCNELSKFDEMNCMLNEISGTLTKPDIVGIVGIGVTVVLALIALRVAWSANRLTESANALAAQAIELTRRAERRRFGEAVQGYYESRREDIWGGKNWNMPHYTHDVLGVANEVQEPNTDVLIAWLTDTIDHVLGSNSYATEDIDRWHFLRQSDAIRLRMTVPIEIGRWIHDPDHYVPERFILEHGAKADDRHDPRRP